MAKKDPEYMRIVLEMAKADKVLFAPKDERSLKLQYPELSECAEFKELNEFEMLFVWGWCCVTSPFLEVPEDDRLGLVIDFAYPTEQLRTMKHSDFAGCDFPASIKLAISKMKTFNDKARIEEQAYLLKVRENCKLFIAQDITILSAEEQDKYWLNVSRANKQMVDTRHAVENGSLGVADAEDTFVPRIRRDLIALYHKRKR